MVGSFLLAAVLWSGGADGVTLQVESETSRIDPGRSVFMTLELKTPKGVEALPPDIRTRARGFSLVEEFAEEPAVAKDGSTTRTVNWKLRPEPCADRYKIAPFAVEVKGGRAFVAGPILFEPPAARQPVEGGIEIDPKKDFPPLSWKLVGWAAACLGAAVLLGAGAWLLARYLLRRLKEHLMSPIERAWVELERLMKKGLPGRGRYKDFYVELTMVVRRYVQRKYGIKAPHMTTDEFFAELRRAGDGAPAANGLKEFLESADLVKFAGVEASPEMADAATESAREYLKADSAAEKKGAKSKT